MIGKVEMDFSGWTNCDTGLKYGIPSERADLETHFESNRYELSYGEIVSQAGVAS